MIISYAWQHQKIFVAQSVWCLASIIGLEQGLVIHINNLKRRSDIVLREPTPQPTSTMNQIEMCRCREEISTKPRDSQKGSRELSHINQNEYPRLIIRYTTLATYSWVNPYWISILKFFECTEQFIQESRKARKQLKKKTNPLSGTRSGTIITKLLSNTQWNHLQSIPKDMIARYLSNTQ